MHTSESLLVRVNDRRRDSVTARVHGALVMAAVLLLTGGAAKAQNITAVHFDRTIYTIPSGPWNGPRTPDGQPDVQGDWSNTVSNHDNLTDPEHGVPGDPSRDPIQLGPRESRLPSRVVDPADGQVPFQPWAKARQVELMENYVKPSKPEYIDPLARCYPGGVPKSMYWHAHEIRQFPGYVLFIFDSGSRLIHLDGGPHLPDAIKLWNADSRGHWEGNTLVVDVANNNAKARFARTGEFASDKVHIVERYVFDPSGKRYSYLAEITDPSVYTQPWTISIPMRKWTVADKPGPWHFEVTIVPDGNKAPSIEHYERSCIESSRRR